MTDEEIEYWLQAHPSLTREEVIEVLKIVNEFYGEHDD